MYELKHVITTTELFEINALLDMEDDINYQVQKQQESARQR